MNIFSKEGEFLQNVKRALSAEVISIDSFTASTENMLGYYKLLKDDKETTPANLIKFKVECRSQADIADEEYGYITNKIRTLRCGQ